MYLSEYLFHDKSVLFEENTFPDKVMFITSGNIHLTKRYVGLVQELAGTLMDIGTYGPGAILGGYPLVFNGTTDIKALKQREVNAYKRIPVLQSLEEAEARAHARNEIRTTMLTATCVGEVKALVLPAHLFLQMNRVLPDVVYHVEQTIKERHFSMYRVVQEAEKSLSLGNRKVVSGKGLTSKEEIIARQKWLEEFLYQNPLARLKAPQPDELIATFELGGLNTFQGKAPKLLPPATLTATGKSTEPHFVPSGDMLNRLAHMLSDGQLGNLNLPDREETGEEEEEDEDDDYDDSLLIDLPKSYQPRVIQQDTPGGSGVCAPMTRPSSAPSRIRGVQEFPASTPELPASVHPSPQTTPRYQKTPREKGARVLTEKTPLSHRSMQGVPNEVPQISDANQNKPDSTQEFQLFPAAGSQKVQTKSNESEDRSATAENVTPLPWSKLGNLQSSSAMNSSRSSARLNPVDEDQPTHRSIQSQSSHRSRAALQSPPQTPKVGMHNNLNRRGRPSSAPFLRVALKGFDNAPTTTHPVSTHDPNANKLSNCKESPFNPSTGRFRPVGKISGGDANTSVKTETAPAFTDDVTTTVPSSSSAPEPTPRTNVTSPSPRLLSAAATVSISTNTNPNTEEQSIQQQSTNIGHTTAAPLKADSTVEPTTSAANAATPVEETETEGISMEAPAEDECSSPIKFKIPTIPGVAAIEKMNGLPSSSRGPTSSRVHSERGRRDSQASLASSRSLAMALTMEPADDENQKLETADPNHSAEPSSLTDQHGEHTLPVVEKDMADEASKAIEDEFDNESESDQDDDEAIANSEVNDPTVVVQYPSPSPNKVPLPPLQLTKDMFFEPKKKILTPITSSEQNAMNWRIPAKVQARVGDILMDDGEIEYNGDEDVASLTGRLRSQLAAGVRKSEEVKSARLKHASVAVPDSRLTLTIMGTQKSQNLSDNGSQFLSPRTLYLQTASPHGLTNKFVQGPQNVELSPRMQQLTNNMFVQPNSVAPVDFLSPDREPRGKIPAHSWSEPRTLIQPRECHDEFKQRKEKAMAYAFKLREINSTNKKKSVEPFSQPPKDRTRKRASVSKELVDDFSSSQDPLSRISKPSSAKPQSLLQQLVSESTRTGQVAPPHPAQLQAPAATPKKRLVFSATRSREKDPSVQTQSRRPRLHSAGPLRAATTLVKSTSVPVLRFSEIASIQSTQNSAKVSANTRALNLRPDSAKPGQQLLEMKERSGELGPWSRESSAGRVRTNLQGQGARTSAYERLAQRVAEVSLVHSQTYY
eukprot:CAMPEP_0175133200 /NCGR_PEP_ID=MMETSP0087-20121206/7508_1 /TAXON_ID=136419 /ORGANISM="Unknown Unknown, Strain D1" /LENGTH=1272 /DNA_ID=CAMNT_0016415659 /DNA_START=72 /DNA_END=3888 /DNA_ORIENTATION=+